MALVLAASAYFRITRELELFERDMIMDHGVLARTLADAMPRVWAEKGRDEALKVLENASTPDGRFRVRWVDGEVPAAPIPSRERHYTDVPIHVHGQAVGLWSCPSHAHTSGRTFATPWFARHGRPWRRASWRPC